MHEEAINSSNAHQQEVLTQKRGYEHEVGELKKRIGEVEELAQTYKGQVQELEESESALLAEKETQISQLEQEKTQLSESHSAQMKNVLREKEELTVSNGQLEDRLQKADLDREQLRLKNKQQASTIASKDKLLEEGGLQSGKLKDTIKELEAQMQRAQQDHES